MAGMTSSFVCCFPGCKVEKPFVRKSDLNRHVEGTHLGLKPYKCTKCPAIFAQKNALKTHDNTHTGAKPFKCGISGCRKAFGDPSSCTRHKRETHGSATRCPEPGCTKSFKRAGTLKKHVKAEHGLDPRVVSTQRRVTCMESLPGVPSALTKMEDSSASQLGLPSHIPYDEPLNFEPTLTMPSMYIIPPTYDQFNAQYNSTLYDSQDDTQTYTNFAPGFMGGYFDMQSSFSSPSSSQSPSPAPVTPIVLPATTDILDDTHYLDEIASQLQGSYLTSDTDWQSQVYADWQTEIWMGKDS